MQIVIEIPNTLKKILDSHDIQTASHPMWIAIMMDAIENGTPITKWNGRKFEEIVVEYPPAELCAYPEYRGKPYFSIKYEENGEHIIGFGTYKPEVLSRYLQEYFIAPIIMEADTESEDRE